MSGDVLPPAVPRRAKDALAAAERAGFPWSSIPQLGRLLAAVAASKPGGKIAESGTGFGYGTAWLHSGLTGAATLITIDRVAAQTALVAAAFADDPRVQVLTGDWRELGRHAPFDVFFCDGGGKREDPQQVIDWLAPGGVLVLDDFAPSVGWPPRFNGAVDDLRVCYLTHPAVLAAEIGLTAQQNAIIAIRR